MTGIHFTLQLHQALKNMIDFCFVCGLGLNFVCSNDGIPGIYEYDASKKIERQEIMEIVPQRNSYARFQQAIHVL